MNKKLNQESQLSQAKDHPSTMAIPSRQAQALWRRAKVEEVTGLKRSTLYSLIKNGLFPAPVKISARSVAWRDHEVMGWSDARNAGSFGA